MLFNNEHVSRNKQKQNLVILANPAVNEKCQNLYWQSNGEAWNELLILEN